MSYAKERKGQGSLTIVIPSVFASDQNAKPGMWGHWSMEVKDAGFGKTQKALKLTVVEDEEILAKLNHAVANVKINSRLGQTTAKEAPTQQVAKRPWEV